MAILLQAASESIPWGALLTQYGPAGIMAGGLWGAAKILVRKLTKDETALADRDARFLASLKERDELLRGLTDRLGEIAADQATTSLLIGSLLRMMEQRDGEALPPGAYKQLVRAVAEERRRSGGKP